MIAVCSTLAAYKCRDGEELMWLKNAEKMLAYEDPKLRFFCAVQVGQGKDDRFDGLIQRLAEINGTYWTFSFDDGETEVTGWKRINDICMGRNLCIEFGMRAGASHVLFLDSDLIVPGDCIQKLLEVDHPLVGGDVPSYCLDGPQVLANWPEENDPPPFPMDADVREHWNTAGFLLVKRDAFRVLRWRHDLENGITDDPSFAADAKKLGFGETWVRHDVIGIHDPLVPVERRGYDRTIATDIF